MPPQTPTRAGIDSQLGRGVLALLARIVPRLPLSAVVRMGATLGWLAPRLTPHRFRKVCGDIAVSLGDGYTDAEVQRIAREAYQYLATSLIEFLRLPAVPSETLQQWAVFEGREHLDAALEAGHGAILMTAHIGNWEVGGTLLALSSYPVTAIARMQETRILDSVLTNVRGSHGLTTLAQSDIRGSIETLKRNECLAILGDVNAKQPGAFVQFFGRPAATFTGVAYLAHATGAQILPIFDERRPDFTHVVHVHPPVPISRTGDKRRDLLITTMRAQRIIEAEIRRRPAEWFWLQPRWKTQPEDVPNPERIPMEHRDLTPEEVAEALEAIGPFIHGTRPENCPPMP